MEGLDRTKIMGDIDDTVSKVNVMLRPEKLQDIGRGAAVQMIK